jgi:CheY-like chemotaxis protein
MGQPIELDALNRAAQIKPAKASVRLYREGGMAVVPFLKEKNTRALIVEDDATQAQILDATLASVGFHTDIVTKGLDAVWAIRERNYDLVLIDYNLPEIDGLGVANLVGDLMGQEARPVLIALTASPDEIRNREGAPQSSFDAIVEKSSDPGLLFAAIARQLFQSPTRAERLEALGRLLLRNWSDFDSPSGAGRADHEVGPARVLVIEDDPTQSLMVQSLLERQGYAVETAADGLEGVRKACEGRFDLAIVDYILPEIDGLAAGRLFQDLIRTSAVPRLVAFTASPERISEFESTSGRVFDAVVEKTSDMGKLLSTVDRLLQLPASGQTAP